MQTLTSACIAALTASMAGTMAGQMKRTQTA